MLASSFVEKYSVMEQKIEFAENTNPNTNAEMF